MTALLGELNESEAASLRRYLERVAAGEAMLPYEDNEAMWLTARGARRLPPERLVRVQQLHAQAITLGLPSRPAPEEPSLPSLPPLPSLPAFEVAVPITRPECLPGLRGQDRLGLGDPA
jgi:hypothetical protein